MAIWIPMVIIKRDRNSNGFDYQIDDVFVIEDESQIDIEENKNQPKMNHMEMSK